MKAMKKIAAFLLVSCTLSSAVFAADAAWPDLNNQVIEMYQKKFYTKAIPVAQQALDLAESTYGANSPEAALSLNNLAMLYKKTKKYPAAEKMYLKALAASEKIVGKDNADLAVPLNNLAMLYESQKNYKKSDEYSKRAISILEKKYGAKHATVLEAKSRYEAMKKARA
jgi:tetratricopeptide (TPR) repeat protein